ncbi:hypothetical protein MW887_010675 [Aspergillus wentii]|nr:hypothetical protein MW887_010675 [Aspergillus wentii]
MSLSEKASRSPSPTSSVPLNDLEANSERSPASVDGFSASQTFASHQESELPIKDLSDSWPDYLDDFLEKLGIFLTPSFLQHRVGGQPPQLSKLHGIAALDGLRGWACLLVFNFHFLFTYTWKVSVGWGFPGDNFGILQFPIFHLLISGHIMVAIFFVISGYVLSYKPLNLCRSRSWEQTFNVLASSTFRRGLRLYIPSLVGISLVVLAVRAGVYDYAKEVIDEGHTIQGTNEQHPPIFKTWYLQYWSWHYEVAELFNFWHWEMYFNYYNPHLWTIPVEFRCSIVLFVTILATSRLVAAVRMTLVCGLIWFCTRWGRWDVILFLSGMLMAELDLIYGTWERSSTEEKSTSSTPNSLKEYFQMSGWKWWIAIFIFGLYLGSSPNTGFKWTPFYMWLWELTPEYYRDPDRFPQSLGAILIVFSINHSKEVQRLFTNPLSQYLGKISYAFYIVHGPILHSLGYSIMPSIWNTVGKETNFQYCLGFLIGWLICLPVSIWAGDIFWRAVDIPSVKFARWIEAKITANPTEQKNGHVP